MDVRELREAMRVGRVQVRRSRRRKKTLTTRLEGDIIVVAVPQSFNVETHVARLADLVTRLEHTLSQRRSGDLDLEERAAALARRYFDDGISHRSVRWVQNQNTLWGSTTSSTRDIRLSHRLQVMPPWVVDAVLVHELAHLRHPDHSEDFKALARRYSDYDRAQAFLAGFSLGQSTPEPRWPGADPA